MSNAGRQKAKANATRQVILLCKDAASIFLIDCRQSSLFQSQSLSHASCRALNNGLQRSYSKLPETTRVAAAMEDPLEICNNASCTRLPGSKCHGSVDILKACWIPRQPRLPAACLRQQQNDCWLHVQIPDDTMRLGVYGRVWMCTTTGVVIC